MESASNLDGSIENPSSLHSLFFKWRYWKQNFSKVNLDQKGVNRTFKKTTIKIKKFNIQFFSFLIFFFGWNSPYFFLLHLFSFWCLNNKNFFTQMTLIHFFRYFIFNSRKWIQNKIFFFLNQRKEWNFFWN